MKQLLLLTICMSLCFVLGVALFSPSIQKVAAEQAQPAATSTLQIKGLKDRVVIRRDDRGIPYIKEKNDEAFFFARVYATATDRLWQMDLFRRNARGELSEVLPKVPNSPV